MTRRNVHARAADAASLCRLIARRNLPLASMAVLGLAFAGSAQGAAIGVTAGAVDQITNSNCSLIEAMQAANQNMAVDACNAGDDASDGGDIVLLPPLSSFVMTGHMPPISSKITVVGNASTVSADPSFYGAFAAAGPGADLTVTGLKISGMHGTPLVASQAILNVVDTEISGSVIPDGVVEYGEPLPLNPVIEVLAGSALTIVGSTLAGNQSFFPGVYVDASTATIANSTISGNDAGGFAAKAVLADHGSVVTIANSTIAGNTSYGADVATVLSVGSSDVHFVNSIAVAADGDVCDNYSGGTISVAGNNLSSDASCTGFTLPGTGPLLGALADNGGSTRTMALLAGSPAIDGAVTAMAPPTDQRGVARPQGAESDLGAYELDTADTAPDAFSFPNASGLPVSSYYATKGVTLGGIATSLPISVEGGEYRLNGGAWASGAGTAANGDVVQLRVLTASTVNTPRKATLTIGSYSASVLAKTGSSAVDMDPDKLLFPNANRAVAGSLQKSATLVPVGYNSAAPISITGTGCTFRVGVGGAYGNTASTISPGQETRMNVTAPATALTKFSCKLTIGGTTSVWIGKTQP